LKHHSKNFQKNNGISFICFDPTEKFIQLLHHCHVIGGSWSNPSKIYVSVLGADKNAKPIQIILKSIKIIKAKSVSMAELVGEGKSDKTEFHFRNILPIPHVLTKAYLELESFNPQKSYQEYLAEELFGPSSDKEEGGEEDNSVASWDTQ